MKAKKAEADKQILVKPKQEDAKVTHHEVKVPESIPKAVVKTQVNDVKVPVSIPKAKEVKTQVIKE